MKLKELNENAVFAVFIKDVASIDDGVLFVNAKNKNDAKQIVKKSAPGTNYAGFKITDAWTFKEYQKDYGSTDLADYEPLPDKYGNIEIHMLGH